MSQTQARHVLLTINPTIPVWSVPADVVQEVGKRDYYFLASLVDRFSWDIFHDNPLIDSLLARTEEAMKGIEV